MPQTESKKKTVRVIVEGRVQGVWFRSWTQQNATARGLAGWVRNRADGSVEALFHGDKRDVNDMLETCWKGPSSSRVDKVTPENSLEAPPFTGFRVYPSV